MTADTLNSLTDQADALKAQGRLEAAAGLYARAVAVAPASGVAEHNLAAIQGDRALFAEAEAGSRRALAKGLDAPETWLVLARALQGLRRFDEAEATYREVLRRRPGMADAHRDLAQLIWMRGADITAATRALDAAIAAHPDAPALLLVKARALEYAGDLAGAYATLQNAISRLDGVAPQVMAADIAARLGEVPAALAHAQRAVVLDVTSTAAQSMLAQSYLAAGQPEHAVAVLEPLRKLQGDDQFLLALLATAWRVLGDPRHRQLMDYENLVRGWRLKPPPGWSTIEAYLAELTQALVDHHAFFTHPFEQSVRHGSQAPNLLNAPHPAIRAFPLAIQEQIDAHLAALGSGDDPLRRRNSGRWKFHGIWSVRLRPNGFHANHVHPDGWLSSACYIDLPAAVQHNGREGWIKFGEPGVPTTPPLPPEHFVKPEPGLLVLFPSYMWHGTVPFTGSDSRLTIAFDLVPA